VRRQALARVRREGEVVQACVSAFPKRPHSQNRHAGAASRLSARLSGTPLPQLCERSSSTSRHQSYHSVYSEFVESKLNKLDVNHDVNVLDKQVFELQQKLRKLQEQGLPLHMTDDYLQKELKRFKSKGKIDYLLDRAANKDKIKPFWDRGGGATLDLWERWFDKL